MAASSVSVGWFGSAAGGSAPKFITHAISSRRAFVAVRFDPPMKSGSHSGTKPLADAAANARDRNAAANGAHHELVARDRRHQPIGREALDDEARQRRRLQHVADHGDEIDLLLDIDIGVVAPIARILDDGDLGDRRGKNLTVAALDRNRHGAKPAALLAHAHRLAGKSGDVEVRAMGVAGGRHIMQQGATVMSRCAEDASMSAGSDVTARSASTFCTLRAAKMRCSWMTTHPARSRPFSSAHTRDAM